MDDQEIEVRSRSLRHGLNLSLIALLNVFLLDLILVDPPTLYHSSTALHLVYRPVILSSGWHVWSIFLLVVIPFLNVAALIGKKFRLKLGILLAFALLHALTDITLPVRLYSGEFAEDWWEEALPHNFTLELFLGVMALSYTLVAEWLMRKLLRGTKSESPGIP